MRIAGLSLLILCVSQALAEFVIKAEENIGEEIDLSQLEIEDSTTK